MFATQFDNPSVDMEADAERATAGVNEAGQENGSSYVQSGFAYVGALDPDMSGYAVRDPTCADFSPLLVWDDAPFAE